VSQVSVRDRRDTRVEAESRAQGLNIGWTAFSYLISGMAAYGGIGWLIGRAVHIQMLFPIGMLVGLAISIGFVIWRFGTSAGAGADAADAAAAGKKNIETGMSAAATRRASHRRGIPREEKSR
jgi:F0F1-type ATP synthase assembly protein I